MTNPHIDQPRIVDEAANAERIALDQQIRTLTDKLSMGGPSIRLEEHRQGLLKLQQLQEERGDAFRRSVGWTGTRQV
ncbi:hypothetical protein D5S18_28280 [Nocardia panacis]|uniref:Uncharacterized protein n=1 Tax=Nocardia panacis TaxID=2340916 RepID=A0A3A4K5R0_9NOCA|nr:hypothetical protein [Nocardia panacis]RJO69800.1 hypothetical protein D5S18_28280 [Nocardia panacis]